MIEYLATWVPVFAAIAGALFTVVSSLALGLCIVRKLAPPVSRPEEFAFAFFSGSGAFSLLVFALLAAHAAYLPVILLAGLGCIVLLFLRFRNPTKYVPAPGRLSRSWWMLALVFSTAYTILYLSRALGPEYSPDGVSYHLALVNDYVWRRHFPVITTNIYASFPQGLEMLFVAAFSIGRHSAATLVHLSFAIAEAALLVLFGLRFRIEKAAMGAMLLFYMAPVVGFDASVAYNDVALSGACFAAFYALLLWASNRKSEQNAERLLILAGAFAGFAGAIKYTGFFAVAFVLVFVIWTGRTERSLLKRRLALAMAPAVLLVAPWLIKNTIEVHNPVSPFANRVFPNPYVHISFEEGYRESMRHYNQVTLPEIPIETTVKGVRLQGIIGPVFLLSPLALFALASPLGRHLLFAFAFFLVPYFGNIGTRFLLPALPFLALALCMALAARRAVLVIVLVLHCVLSLPWVLRMYAPHAMRLDVPDWDETLRWLPEDWVLSNRMPGYAMARYIDRHLPLSAHIFEAGGVSESYLRQRIDNSYQAAQNEKAYGLLSTGAFPAWRATERHTFGFAPRQLRSVRIEQAAQDNDPLWTIGEVHLLSDGHELTPAPDWTFASKPNPWDARLAFDGNPATVWSTWEHIRPGMYVEIQFKNPVALDGIELDCPRYQAGRMVIKGVAAAGGQEVTLSTTNATGSIPSPPDFRKRVTAALRELGYTHLVLSSKQLCYQEVHSDPAEWNMKLIAERGEYALFSLGDEYSREAP